MINNISIVILVVMIMMVGLTLVFGFRTVKQIFRRTRSFKWDGIKGFFSLLSYFLFLTYILWAIYYFPRVFMNGIDWQEISQSYPSSFIIMIVSVISAVSLFFI